MKKITLSFFCAFLTLFGFAQTAQNFGANGPDSGPTVLTINDTDITVNGGNPITNITLGTFTTHYNSPTGTTTQCGNWYGFILDVTGGVADGTSLAGCDAEFNGLDVTGFTTITLTTTDPDVYTDTVFFDIDLLVTFTVSSPPNCDAELTSPVNGNTNAPTNGDITWSAASGGADGYKLTVGTTTGGSEVLAQTDVGNVTTYSLGALAQDTQYFVNIVPYNANGDATGCTENTFTTVIPPPNDLPAGAIPITPSPQGTGCATATFTLPFSTDFTSDSGVQGGCSTSGLDQFFSWTASSEGLKFWSSTPGSPGIVIWDANTLAEIDCASTFATDFTLSGWTVGQDLVIQIYDFEGSTSDVAFCLEEYTPPAPEVNDICSGAINVACDETVTGDTSAENVTDTVGNSSADLWYSYSGAAGDITASLCGSSYDTNIRVYDSCGGTQIATNDDSCSTQSEVTFTADGSSTYYIAVEGFNTAEGAFTMTLTCLETIPPPANDAFADAEALVTGVATSGTTAGATENLADEKPSCDLFGNIADVWYTYTQPANTDTMIITTSISGTSSEANCAVYSAGEPILEENQVACGDEGQASGEMLEFAATPGTTYYIRVWSDGALPPVSGRVEGTFNVTADAALSTDEFDNPAVFTYYPNPVKNTLTLNAQNNIEDVRVYNMLGQEVMNAQPQAVDSDIDMSSLETGTYFVQVTIASITKTVRVIKQ